MENTRNPNYGYGRRGGGSSGRGRGGGRGRTQDYQSQGDGSGGRGRGGGRGSTHDYQSQGDGSGGRGRGGGRGSGRRSGQDYQSQGGGRGQHGMNRGRDNQPPVQPASPMRPPQQQQQPGGSAAGGRGGAWTARPWGPSPSPPIRSPAPPPQPSVDELTVEKLQISDHKSLPSASGSGGKDTQIQVLKRPDRGGTIAVRSIGLLVNHFRVNFDPNRTILHYDVDVKLKLSEDKGVIQRKMRKADMCLIKEKLFSDNSMFEAFVTAYDGEKNIFSALPLPEGQYTVDISEGEGMRSGSYTFTIKLVNELRLSKLVDYMRGITSHIPRDILHGMDLVMKENPSRKRICVGRGFYSVSDGIELSRSLEAYAGFQQSLKPTSQGLSLCLDYSILAFRKPLPVIEFLEQHIPGFKINDIGKWKRAVNETLEGLLVRVTHRRTKQKYAIRSLTEKNACNIDFDLVDQEGKIPTRRIKLLDYFKEKWHVDVEYKNIPCLELGRSEQKSNKVPLEFCVLVEGQRYPKEDLDRNAGAFLKNLSLAKPFDRMNRINKMVKSDDGPCGGGVARGFGIDVDTNMTRVQGRVINPPEMKLRNSTVTVDGERCQWNLVGKRSLVDAKPVDRWGLLEFVDNKRRYDERRSCEFVNNLTNRSRNLGMPMEYPIVHHVAEMDDLMSVERLEHLLRRVIQESGEGKLQFVACAMTEKHFGYKNLKWVAETRIGVVTQCYLSPTAANPRGQDQYMANLCLKINAKLGGSNFEIGGNLKFSTAADHVMFIGADVNHPTSRDKSFPSIAAVVGTVNWPAANRYAARVVPQAHRKEQILNFGALCMDLVNTYGQMNGVRPGRIVIFRDGVSDGQFEMALDKELRDVKEAFSNQNYSPRITLIVAQKRHQTRLFVENERDGGRTGNVPPGGRTGNVPPGGRTGNVPPGTVVDTVIVHPYDFDFYLCSHFGGIGTSKPTHYYVLWDENSFTSDQLQKLIYDMCFTFARCTKPVSLVPPVYYADLVAYRGRMFQETRTPTPANASSLFDESLYKMHPDMENVMFFI